MGDVAPMTIASPNAGWRQRLWTWYVRQPAHPMKLRLERWLARGLGLRRVRLGIPGPAVLDLPIGEHLTNAVAHLGCYERATLERVMELCATAQCFLDVGGQFGQFTMAASAVLPTGGRVITVEPNPQNYLELCRNLTLNNRTNVYPILAAATDVEGFLRLVPQTVGNTGSTYTRSDIRAGEMIVPALPLAELLRRLAVDRVDVMKMDIEGAELAALRGLFSGGIRPRHIFFEHLPETFANCDETLALLTSEGYGFRQVDGQPFDPIRKPLDDNLWAELERADHTASPR